MEGAPLRYVAIAFAALLNMPTRLLPVNGIPEFNASSIWIRGRSIYAWDTGPFNGTGGSPILLAVRVEGR